MRSQGGEGLAANAREPMTNAASVHATHRGPGKATTPKMDSNCRRNCLARFGPPCEACGHQCARAFAVSHSEK
jgi:hypothetical protein